MNPYLAWPKSAKVASVLFMVISGGFILISAKEILIPIALAVLVAFLLHPLVKRLTRWGIPRIAAVILVVGTSSAFVAGLGYVVSSQLKSFADELPSHEPNIELKVRQVKAMFKGGTLDRLTRMFQKINRRTEEADPEAAAREQVDKGAAASPETAEVAREVTDLAGSAAAAAENTVSPGGRGEAAPEPPPATSQAGPPADLSSAAASLMNSPLISSIVNILATAGIVILLVTFFLVQQSDIRDRIVSVAGRGALATTTKALEEAGMRISRYLLMLFVVNSTYGIAVAFGLWLMGVPYAIMWGLAAGLVRYVPYVGPWIGATMPIAVSLATSQGWWQPLWVIGLFVVLELLSNNVMEPILYGHSVGLSELGVILAAIVWAWLWGPIGLVLATPMTVCLVVLGRYVPGLRIFDQMFGEGAAVNPAVRLYQRLLARDGEEAEELVEEFLKEKSVIETADNLIIPAVSLVRQDLAHDQIDDSDAERMSEMLRDLMEEVIDKGRAGNDATPPGETNERPLVMGVAAHSEEEAVLLNVLNAVCSDAPCRVEILSSKLLQSERLAAITERSPELVIVSALPPGDLPYARQLCKRLKATGSARRIVVARWGHAKSVDRSPQLRAAGADDVVSTMAELEPMIQTVYHMQQVSRLAGNAPEGRAVVQAG
ncbi:AI-2 transport protein TqsA [Caulifigura coniformis]|uniref:AI-2 transport protein TqsA n=1 Tax=Caulifigura coniformis TaxID=2527983 RepID=A0A517SBS3_9PLAN|nr:AI-2E family transporter [Caulifigura coniformis]QDT53587.1 AI-2 transport protein TqsA [Caulifigura coniformis]